MQELIYFMLATAAFTVFFGFIVFCFIIIFIEKVPFHLLLKGDIRNIFNKHRKIDLFLFGVSSLLIGFVLYEYFILPIYIDFDYIRDYQNYILTSHNIFYESFEKAIKMTTFEPGYRPRILAYLFTVLDTNLMLLLNKYVGGGGV